MRHYCFIKLQSPQGYTTRGRNTGEADKCGDNDVADDIFVEAAIWLGEGRAA